VTYSHFIFPNQLPAFFKEPAVAKAMAGRPAFSLSVSEAAGLEYPISEWELQAFLTFERK
jgi:hypothetical protein